MPRTVSIEAFFQSPGPILDVRSPGEFEQGHIPGALSFPLFTDEERAQVGTCYKQQGRDEAVELGFAIAGPKFASFIHQAKDLAPDRQIRVHCWRGGLRSSGLGQILEMGGLHVVTLEGGYKTFRHWVRSTLATPKPILVLGGMTGSDKTSILQALACQKAQVLDLEGLANHRGSSYGGLNMPPQPSVEHFENLIALQWAAFDPHQPVWIEAESRRIGLCRIPDELFMQMEGAPTLEVTRPLAERLDLLTNLYGQVDRKAFIEATERIRKRLGGQRTQQAVTLVREGNLRAAIAIILDYYDRTYRYDLDRRQKVIPQVDITGLNAESSARLVKQTAVEVFGEVSPNQSDPAPSQPMTPV